MQIPTPEDWEKAGSVASLLGRRVFFRREGKGPTLLCIHGYPTSSWDWAKMWPDLVADWDVVAPDMLGFGFSDKPRGHRYTIAEQADLHVALLKELGIEEFDVLCHDYGVTVMQELLARRREGALRGLRSVVFLNGGLFPETHRARTSQKLLASPIGPMLARAMNLRGFERSMRAIFGPHSQPPTEELAAFFRIIARNDGKIALAGLISYMEERRSNRERWVGALIACDLPMRFVNGSHDPVSGAHMIARLLELKPDADVVRLDVGHYPQVEDADGVLAAFRAFHGSLGRPAPGNRPEQGRVARSDPAR